ncbi:unnamed protein product [Paramecium pentaurelia]|uniref:Uncharacterized protein n=1 Tax=Paramecium pentaurelia TaxID=43138 RepID=A0A8S1TCN3_9CILI|nr:unnamed protein product [Paramecium pentaurelia]
MGIPESKTTIEAYYNDYHKANQKKQQNYSLSVEADCCQVQRNDYIILTDCRHLYHLNCWQQKQKESEGFICFCESKIQGKHCYKGKNAS